MLASAFWSLIGFLVCDCVCAWVSLFQCNTIFLGHYSLLLSLLFLLLSLLLSTGAAALSFPLRLKNHRQIAFYYHHFSSPLRLLLDPFIHLFFLYLLCAFYPTATPTIKLYILSITICRSVAFYTENAHWRRGIQWVCVFAYIICYVILCFIQANT